MSEEEKAIEHLKILKKHLGKDKQEMIDTGTYKFYEAFEINLDTALNLINKLRKENEKYKYLYQKALDNTVKSDKENMDLKKQIDLMGEVIFKKFKAPLVIEYGIENKEQFMEMFKKLAEENTKM